VSELQVRRYRPEDAEAVRRISCETALYGQSMDALFQGRPLISEALIGYYSEFEPEALFVAESQGRVIGYLTGCLDSRRFEAFFARHILLRLLWISLREGYWHRPAFWKIAGAAVSAAGRWSKIRDEVLARYPAHCHLNLDAAFRQAGTGSTLLEVFFHYMAEHKVRGIHIVSATEGGKSFFTKNSFSVLARYAAPHLPGSPHHETWVMGKELQ